MAGFGRLAAVEADRRQGASKAENYGRGPWQEGLRNSTLYITLVALQYKYILDCLKAKPNKHARREWSLEAAQLLTGARRVRR